MRYEARRSNRSLEYRGTEDSGFGKNRGSVLIATLGAVVVLGTGCHTGGNDVPLNVGLEGREAQHYAATATATATATAPTTVRQLDANGQRLPFTTDFANRWNRANDGTEYEPCTALTDGQLEALGVAPSTVGDSAGTNGQTARGCYWVYAQRESEWEWTVTQIVGNSPSLGSDKRRKRSSFDIWMDDIEIEGRTVGLHRLRDGRDCDTYVQSGRAAVTTLVIRHGPPGHPIEEICARAIEFTKATIGKMPR